MSANMNTEVTWVRYEWDLGKVNALLTAPEGYSFRSARRDELAKVTALALSAYASDPAWVGLLAGIRQRITERVAATIGTLETEYLGAEWHGQIIAISGVAKQHESRQNLLTGVCVSPFHQRQGLGRYLLNVSLIRLREFGLSHARVYTTAGSIADRKLYPAYGATRTERVQYLPATGQR